MGFTFPEVIISIVIFGAIVAMGYGQRNDTEGSGSTAQVVWIPLFLFITYRSVMSWAFGISFERGMYWHSYLSLLATLYGLWHGAVAIFWDREIDDDDDDRMIATGVRAVFDVFTTGEESGTYVTGALCSLFMVLLVITSISPIRKYFGRVWLWSHHIFIIAAVVFAFIHGAGLVVAGVAIYLVDRAYGYIFQSWIQYRSIGSEAKVKLVSKQYVHVSIPNHNKGIRFLPGQFLCLCIPRVSIFEYHAYSICSAPSDDHINILISRKGMWTKKLVKCLEKQQSGNDKLDSTIASASMRVLFHGPVGKIGLDWQSTRYESFVLVAGGVGITPMISVYRYLLDQHKRGRPLQVVHMIWSVRDPQLVHDTVSCLAPADIIEIGTMNQPKVSDFISHIYITRQEEANDSISYPFLADENSVESRLLGRVEWHQGRPDMKNVLGIARDSDILKGSSKTRIAVLGCGPSSMTNSLCKAAKRQSGNGVEFDVHLEHFF